MLRTFCHISRGSGDAENKHEAAEIIYAGFTIDRDMIDLAYR